MEQAESLKVLCIEDEPEMVELIRLILGQYHIQVIGAIGGRQGIEALNREKPDLVLLDIMMPEVDGWEVFRHLRGDESLKDTPVIAVTAKAQSIDRVLGLHVAKVDAYITKPFGPQELVQSVQRVLEKRGKALPPK